MCPRPSWGRDTLKRCWPNVDTPPAFPFVGGADVMGRCRTERQESTVLQDSCPRSVGRDVHDVNSVQVEEVVDRQHVDCGRHHRGGLGHDDPVGEAWTDGQSARTLERALRITVRPDSSGGGKVYLETGHCVHAEVDHDLERLKIVRVGDRWGRHNVMRRGRARLGVVGTRS